MSDELRTARDALFIMMEDADVNWTPLLEIIEANLSVSRAASLETIATALVAIETHLKNAAAKAAAAEKKPDTYIAFTNTTKKDLPPIPTRSIWPTWGGK